MVSACSSLQGINCMTIILSLIAWGLVVGFICTLGVASVEGWKQLRRMHQVPCSRCVYFTGDYNLKCTVRPCDALTEQAIGCRDFEVVTRKRPRFENPIPKEIWKYFQPKVNLPENPVFNPAFKSIV